MKMTDDQIISYLKEIRTLLFKHNLLNARYDSALDVAINCVPGFNKIERRYRLYLETPNSFTEVLIKKPYDVLCALLKNVVFVATFDVEGNKLISEENIDGLENYLLSRVELDKNICAIKQYFSILRKIRELKDLSLIHKQIPNLDEIVRNYNLNVRMEMI